ncbi:SAM-dependent methyltransferase [Saccharomonospora amisosensis]|uniref:SAM-dependent methyltransferase n=1 Tax=Saccharomonospora amisosensis TaxID=1128677 RepID=A0A7X5UPS5_9PSEU|nr:methyltransferase domain-containing protein [Saccharomonospora amisosensis]NIJ11930.1 SAM-dependent methyltransferase [Saccharomonospora amisosensis]
MNLTRLAGRLSRMGGRSDRAKEIMFKQALRVFYLSGKPPWDSGVAAPELAELVEGTHALPAGRALDLGCGTGTNTVYLSRHGWDVTGVDLIGRAVRRARRKARSANVHPVLLRGDVTRLDELPVRRPFTLFFDLSCYCGIPLHRRDAYAEGVTRLAASNAHLLMFGYGPGAFEGDDETGVTADELRSRFPEWELTAAVPGTNPVPTFWFTLRKRA